MLALCSSSAAAAAAAAAAALVLESGGHHVQGVVLEIETAGLHPSPHPLCRQPSVSDHQRGRRSPVDSRGYIFVYMYVCVCDDIDWQEQVS